MCFRIAIRDFPIGGNDCQPWRTGGRLCNKERIVDKSMAMSHRVSGNRKSCGHKHCVVKNAESPMESLTTVTRRQWSCGSDSSR
jgi:hypothetical protein